jgi:drug/metabolite transporter (DMT)-like permease
MSSRLLSWIILLALVLTWGSSFILIKKGLLYFDPISLGSLRVVITFLFLLPVAVMRLRRFDKTTLLWLALSGIIGNFFPSFLFAKAQTGIDSGTAGLLNSLTPLFTIIAGFLLFRIRVRLIQVAGVVIGLSGAVGLMRISGGNSFSFNIYYASFIMLATVFYAINVNLIKARLAHVDILSIASIAFFMAGLPGIVVLFGFSNFIQQVASNPQWYIGFSYIALLAVVGTGLAMIAFNKLIKMTSPVFASSVTYLIPLVAMLWGVADDEIFSFQHLLWIALILGGVVLVNLNKYHKNKA